MPHRLAIIGPTGAGKSRLCRLLAARGAHVIEADRVGHEIVDQADVQAQLAAAFGRDILDDATRKVDRAILGQRVFAHPAQREKLDQITHPALAAVLECRLAAADAANAPLVILEAAVYFLLPGPPAVDAVIAVVANPAIRRQRLLDMGLDVAQADARIAGQAHLEATWGLADRIITNDGDEGDLAAAARAIWREYSRGGEA